MRLFPIPLTLVLIVAVIIFGCAMTLSKSGVPEPGTYIKKMPLRVYGVRRSYLVHVPKQYTHGISVPLLIVLHGAFGTAKEVEKLSGFSELSDRETFIVAYPNGAFGILGFLQHWNAGHCCGKAASDNIDDIGFLDRVIADVQERFTINSNRVYMAGFSNGGMLAYRYAAERSHTIAALSTVSASLNSRVSENSPLYRLTPPEHPVPLISFHGKDDLKVPYGGGKSPLKRGPREYFSVEQSIGLWVDYNKIQVVPHTELLYNGLITKKTWAGHNNTNSVVLYSIEEWKHIWPSKYFTGTLDRNHPLRGFDAPEIIWQFLRQHKRS